jgi:hypothetical protein
MNAIDEVIVAGIIISSGWLSAPADIPLRVF